MQAGEKKDSPEHVYHEEHETHEGEQDNNYGYFLGGSVRYRCVDIL
jgi:hypothetical protein